MNETYEWLYDNYALPLMQAEKDADDIIKTIIACGDPARQLFLRDQLNSLCQLWGMDAFAVGLQMGLRLMAGQRADGLAVS